MPKKSKPKTQVQIDRATDARLQKTYGVTLNWYNSQFEKQGGVCAITGKPPGTRRLHVDHDHSWAKSKISYEKVNSGVWAGSATYLGKRFEAVSGSKSGVSRKIKYQLLRASVRGLLTYTANAGLQKFQDNPKFLRAAAKYLEDHQESNG